MKLDSLAALAATALLACGDDGPPTPSQDADTAVRSVVLEVPAVPNRDVDMLFLVDDSPSMVDKQIALNASFPTFVTQLDFLPGGRPNIHLGVVTSDLGTRGADDPAPGPAIGSGPGACAGTGKSGNLQTQGTPLVTGNFISDLQNADLSRAMNYTGSLADAFSAIASAGQNGCGFEQPLEAIRLALDNNAANAGFLRPAANLAVIVLSDEDDCSMAHSSLMGTDTATLGPLESFRCTRFGITCDTGGTTTDEMNTPGSKALCHSNESSDYLTHAGAIYVSFLKGLKTDPRTVMMAALVGNPTPVAVELRPPPGGGAMIPALTPSCDYMVGTDLVVADPAVRIAGVAQGFAHNTVASVCSDDLTSALGSVSRQLASLLGSPCLQQPIADPQNCLVVDTNLAGTKTTLPACPSSGDCYTIASDNVACPTAPNLRLTVTRTTAPAADIVTTVSCTLP